MVTVTGRLTEIRGSNRDLADDPGFWSEGCWFGGIGVGCGDSDGPGRVIVGLYQLKDVKIQEFVCQPTHISMISVDDLSV